LTRAILLVDHGSRRAAANELLGQIAESLRDRTPSCVVEIAHMEIAPPSIADGIAACVAAGADEIVVHPYFLGPGRHTSETIPELVKAAARAHAGLDIRISAPLGIHPKLVDVILDRLREA
jgi:sirohydrochlorin ferrochelatase